MVQEKDTTLTGWLGEEIVNKSLSNRLHALMFSSCFIAHASYFLVTLIFKSVYLDVHGSIDRPTATSRFLFKKKERTRLRK
jgi:hypothetical protein